MTLRLYLVRHGQTDGNAEGRSQGRRDVPLNALGERQAAAVGARFASRPIVAVYASPLARCLATASAIAAPHGLPVGTDDRLVELDHGLLDGLSSAELRRDYPDVLAQWRGDAARDLVMPGGESMRQAQERFVAATEAIVARHPDGEVVVVSHNLATRAFICAAMGVPLPTFHRFRHELAAFAEVERLDDDGWQVLRLNEQCHLEPERP